jgi:hypothetical protein
MSTMLYTCYTLYQYGTYMPQGISKVTDPQAKDIFACDIIYFNTRADMPPPPPPPRNLQGLLLKGRGGGPESDISYHFLVCPLPFPLLP